MAKQPPLTDNERDLLMASGGYGNIQQAINRNETSLDSKGWGGVDPYAQGKATPYPAQALGYETFYPKTAYARLGFNPFVNNYEKYKEGTTRWEDFLDAQHASSTMMWGMTSFFGMGGGDQSTYSAARDYEKLVDLGSPVGKTDTFSWALKQYVQAGYTKAIITSIVAEELALAGATALTRGKTAGAAWAKTVKNFNRIAHIGDVAHDVKKFEDIYDMSKIAKQTESARKTVDNLQDVSKARSFWQKSRKMAGQAADATADATRWTAKKVFPHAAGYVNAVKKGEYAMNGFANATHAFGSFWREAREFKLAFEEADLEKAFIQKDAMAQLTDKYRAENGGKNPEGKALENIQELAGAAGDSGKLVNSFLIYGTNKFGFNSLFTRFAPKVANESIKASKYGKSFINKANIKKGTVASMDFVKKGTGLKGAFGINQMKYHIANLKKSPMRSLKYLARASAMGTTEGTQEYFQEVIQDAEISRAVKSYGKTLDGNWLDYYATSMNKFISPEGAEVFASGFFMGAFAGPHKFMVNKGADLVHGGASYLSGNYKKSNKTAQEMQERYESQVNKLNDMFKNPWSKDQALGALMRKRKQTELGVEQDQAIEEGDESTFDHVVDDQTLETIYNAIDNDVLDTLIDQIEQMDQLSDEEVLEAFKDVIGEDATAEDILEFKEKAKNVIENARYIEKLKKDVDKRYINPFTYGVGEKGDDTTFGLNPYFMHNAFEYTKKQIVKNHYSYKRTLERQDTILKALTNNPPFWNKSKNGPASDVTVLFNQVDLSNEISLLKKELEVAKEVPSSDMTAQQKSDLKFKQDKYDLLNGKTVKDKDGKKTKEPGLYKLIEELRHEYTKDELNEKLKADYKKAVEEGAVEMVLGISMPVDLNTKAGGKGIIIEVSGNSFKVKKENGRVVTVLKSNVSLDQAAALEHVYNQDKLDADSKTAADALYKMYNEYMHMIAKKNGNNVDEAALEKSFQKLLDFYGLERDGKNLTNYLNVLMNPKGFENSLRRRAVVEEHLWKNKKTIIQESLQSAYEAKELNFLLQELASEHNVFIAEEDVLKIQDPDFTMTELRMMELTFYDKTNIKPIDKVSERHRDSMAEVREYLDKRWKKQDEARTEYKVGDEIKISDIVDNEEVVNKIKAANKDNKKATLVSMPVEGVAEINIDDELIQVKLKEISKPEVTPETPAAEAAPVKTVAKEISTDVPFEEWDNQELKDEVQLMFDKFMQNISEREDLPAAAKETMLNQTIDEWINNPGGGRGRVTALISKHNAAIKKEAAPIKAPVKVPKAEPPEKKTEIEEPASIRMDHPIAELELPSDVKDAIISGKATLTTIGMSPSETQPIVQALKSRDVTINSIKDVTPDKESMVVIKVTSETGIKYDILLSYKGKQTSALAAKDNLELAIKLGLPNEATGVYQHPVKIGEEITFYASSKDQASWFDGGSQHVFAVRAQESYEEPTKNEEQEHEEWVTEITDRLAEAKTIPELDEIFFNEIIPKNEINNIRLEHDALDALKAKAAAKIGIKASELSPGEAFILSDSLRKSGVTGEIIMGVVETVSDDSVTFNFPYSEGDPIVIPSKNLAKLIVKQIDPTQMNEELAKAGTELSSEEKEAVDESKDTADDLLDDAAEVKDALDKAENSSIEEVRDNFWNNTIKKDNC
jgi:hypothetical protein